MGEISPAGRRQRRRWSRLITLTAAVGLVVVGYVVSQNHLLTAAEFNGYRVVDGHTIEVTVAVAPRSWTRLTHVVETPTGVRVAVESLPYPQLGPATAELDLVPVVVPLAAELAGRAVTDPSGEPIPQR